MVRTLVHGSSMEELIALFVGISTVPAAQAQRRPAVSVPGPAALPALEPQSINTTQAPATRTSTAG